MKDLRIIQAKKILSNISVTKIYNNAMITSDNKLVIIDNDTLLLIIELFDVLPSFQIHFNIDATMNMVDDEYEPETNNAKIKRIQTVYMNYSRVISNPNNLLACDPVLRGIEEFEKLLSMKASDGSKYYVIHGNNIGDNYFVPIFSNFPSINKPDQIGISIYQLEYGYNLVLETIFKKKINRNINILFRTLDLGRKL